jgi:hypothetical protein
MSFALYVAKKKIVKVLINLVDIFSDKIADSKISSSPFFQKGLLILFLAYIIYKIVSFISKKKESDTEPEE